MRRGTAPGIMALMTYEAVVANAAAMCSVCTSRRMCTDIVCISRLLYVHIRMCHQGGRIAV